MIERLIVGPLHTNTFIVTIAKKQCVIIDPGAEPERILARLEVLNVVPQAILLTHGHLDHVAASLAIINKYSDDSRNVPVLLHPADEYLLEPGDDNEDAREIFDLFGDEGRKAFYRMLESVPQVEPTLSDGESIAETDLLVMHTPGHTPGSVSFYSESLGMVFSGDTLFFKAIGRTDLKKSDKELLERSIHNRLFTLPEETRLFPGHGPNSTIEREKANNRFSSDHQMV